MTDFTPGRNTLRLLLTTGAVILFTFFLNWANTGLNGYELRILNLIAINGILGLSLNLIYGMTGMFSLGHAGFMAIGAYVSALLVLTPTQKEAMWILDPIAPWLLNISAPFWLSLIFAGLIAAFFGWLIALPILRLGGDYLGIATLGFAEIIRIFITNLTPITNGSLGLKGIPAHTTLWVSYGCLAIVLFCTVCLMKSNFGNVLRAIRDDAIAASTMGINTFRTRVLAFTIGCFGGGLGGALLGNLITTIDPRMFMITQTYTLLMIIVVGGLGSITGSLIGAVLVTTMLEWLRFVENPITIGTLHIPGIPGMRMVIFSALLVIVILFRREGIMGMKEFSWDWFFPKKRRATKDSATSTENVPALELQHITLKFGGLTAVDDISFSVEQGKIVGLIGPNGAGKTSVFNVISGFYKPTSGVVRFCGKQLSGLSPSEVCRKGLSRTFQNIRLFDNETVLENVMVGSWVRQKTKWWMSLLPFVFVDVLREDAVVRAHSMDLLRRLDLEDICDEKSASLPYGAKRRLEIARALATNPTFLLLDEPAAGMNPQESEELLRFIRQLRDNFNLTILLIEHDMSVVMNVCDEIHVMDQGQHIASGCPEDIRSNPKVIEAYLGAGAAQKVEELERKNTATLSEGGQA